MDNSPNHQMDVLLISIADQIYDERSALPLGIALLKGILQEKHYTVHCIDSSFWESDRTSLPPLIEEYHPRIIGISATAYYLDRLCAVIKIIRSISIEIPVILGGYCSLIPDLLDRTQADAICHGEGDETILELVAAFLMPEEEREIYLSRIHGISYFKRIPNSLQKTVYRTESRNLLKNLDIIPFPDYSDFKLHHYSKDLWIPIYTQRGCYNNCTFCDIIPFYGKQQIRAASPAYTVKLIQKLIDQYQIHFFNFVDDNFLSTKEYLSEFFTLLNSVGLKGKIQISFQTRANDVLRFKDILSRWKDFLLSIELGLESFADSQLTRYRKNVTSKQNLDAIQFLIETNIPFINYYLFLDAGTTLDELRCNVDQILRLPNVPYQTLHEKIPEMIVNHDYSSVCDLYGKSTIENIPFLAAFEYVLEETLTIKPLIVLYISLRKVLESPSNSQSNSQFSGENPNNSIVSGMAQSVIPLVEQLVKDRLKLAWEISEKVAQHQIKFGPKIPRKINNMIQKFNQRIQEIIVPFQKIGVDLKTITRLN